MSLMVLNPPVDCATHEEDVIMVNNTEAMKKKVIESLGKVVEVRVDSDNMNISNSLALICALSIPKALCPSTHGDFLKKYEEEHSTDIKKSEMETIHQLAVSRYPVKMKPKIVKKRRGRLRKRKAPVVKKETNKPTSEISQPETDQKCTVQENVVNDGRTPCCSKSLSDQITTAAPSDNTGKPDINPVKENLSKSKHGKSKRWIEDEKPVVNIVGPNELLINGKLVVVDYSNFTKETDVPTEYEIDDSVLPPLPGCVRPCKKDFCQLGCICKSIVENEIVRSRCQNVKCMFGCICYPSSNIVDDGDIRSRLRPRVSLLNWKHSDNTEKDTMANYKQLERGIISLRGKRNPQTPSRLRNEYVLDGVRNPLQPLPERNIRKRMRHKPYYSLISNQNGRTSNLPKVPAPTPTEKTTKESDKRQVNGRSNLKQKRSMSDESMTSIQDNAENQTEFPLTSHENPTFEVEEEVQISYEEEEEVPTILYQKIGTAPDMINDEFLKSSTTAITSYWTVKKLLKDTPPREQVKRQDGRVVLVSWTATRRSPKVIPRLANVDKNVAGDHVVLPLLPENSEWLMYEFPKNYEKSSCISFTDIGLIVFTKVLIFQKIQADVNNKVVRMKLKHPERRNAMSSIHLHILPRVGNLVVLGPVKKDFSKTSKITFPQTLSYIRHLHRKNFFGSSHFWDYSFSINQETLAEPFSVYIKRKREEDKKLLTGRYVAPEVMEQIIPELMETYEPNEVPASLRPLPSLRKKHTMQLKWSDSIKCSANFHPRLKPYQNAVPLSRFAKPLTDEEIYSSPAESEEDEPIDSGDEVSDAISVESDVTIIDEIKYNEDCAVNI